MSQYIQHTSMTPFSSGLGVSRQIERVGYSCTLNKAVNSEFGYLFIVNGYYIIALLVKNCKHDRKNKFASKIFFNHRQEEKQNILLIFSEMHLLVIIASNYIFQVYCDDYTHISDLEFYYNYALRCLLVGSGTNGYCDSRT